MAYGVLVEAEYEDGFVLTEDEADQSPYEEGRNIFHAILSGAPEKEHGKMVRWSAITTKLTYSIDWSHLSHTISPRPIYYRKMERDFEQGAGWVGPPRAVGHFFGYQYNRPDGSNVQHIDKLVL